MANRTRAERRHHYRRMIVKRTKQDSTRGVGLPNEKEWLFMHARVRARTGTLCSCSMCCSPRYVYGNGKAAKTWQELAALENLKER